jgi:hypothetical protein
MYKIFSRICTGKKLTTESTPFIHIVVKMSHSRPHSQGIVPLFEEKFAKVIAKTKKIPYSQDIFNCIFVRYRSTGYPGKTFNYS